MSHRPTSNVIEALRATLEQVEERCDLGADDPTLVELRRIVLNRVADLQSSEAGTAEPADARERLDLL